MRLNALFRPKSVAVVGASDKPTIGKRLIASLERIGFSGSIFPVNPGYSTVSGRKCYASIAELPEAPDVAAFCVGHTRVLDPLIVAAERGVKGAVIYDGGFGKRDGEGRRLQTKIEGICRDDSYGRIEPETGRSIGFSARGAIPRLGSVPESGMSEAKSLTPVQMLSLACLRTI